MSRQGSSSGKNAMPQPPVKRILMAESAMLVIATVLCWTSDSLLARSVFLGGLVYLLPQVWFATRAFRYQGANAAPLVVKSFYRGEAGKFLLTTAAFIAVFILVRPLNVVAFFSAFAVLNLTNVILVARLSRG